VLADVPANWIKSSPDAYVLSPGSFNIEGSLQRVNDTIDFLNFRDDLQEINARLVGDSGDLEGSGINLRVGVWRGLELFYQRQQQELMLEVSPSSRTNIVDLDRSLDTERTEYGLNWVLYEENNRRSNSPWRSIALELSRAEGNSDEFGGSLEWVQLSSTTTVSFDPPQRFALNRLEDESWQARLVATQPISRNSTLSVWASYGRAESSSGTYTEIDLQSIANAFYQTFDAKETITKAGFSINWQPVARLPIQAGYEYIHISDRDVDAVTSNSTMVPSFLRGSNLGSGARKNHTAFASVNWWITQNVYVGATGRWYRNQFAGVVPHYNNPLSSRFSETNFGYAELKLGVRFGKR